MFELSVKEKLTVPHLRCKTSFFLVPLSLSLSVLAIKPNKNIINFRHFSQNLLDLRCYRLFFWSAFTFQFVRSVVQGGYVWWGVSCKHPLTWWTTPFVAAPGIDLKDTWYFISLFSLHPSTFLTMESLIIRVFFLSLFMFTTIFIPFALSYFCWSLSSLVLIKVVLSWSFSLMMFLR